MGLMTEGSDFFLLIFCSLIWYFIKMFVPDMQHYSLYIC